MEPRGKTLRLCFQQCVRAVLLLRAVVFAIVVHIVLQVRGVCQRSPPGSAFAVTGRGLRGEFSALRSGIQCEGKFGIYPSSVRRVRQFTLPV